MSCGGHAACRSRHSMLELYVMWTVTMANLSLHSRSGLLAGLLGHPRRLCGGPLAGVVSQSQLMALGVAYSFLHDRRKFTLRSVD